MLQLLLIEPNVVSIGQEVLRRQTPEHWSIPPTAYTTPIQYCRALPRCSAIARSEGMNMMINPYYAGRINRLIKQTRILIGLLSVK
jgi:hypothetical protein